MMNKNDIHNLIKVNPLCNWSEEDVEQYVKKHHVPYNKLQDKGYPSIGCQPCTRAIQPGEDIRAGRWWWDSPVRIASEKLESLFSEIIK